ncbi:MmgE/PrpD family protein [Edwardsiella hoshinae]|uniref:MmgE/PrpD family n=1 Tax=Edwardsiella hoshinae TaxID=93378 RepID=A0A376DJP4_9GAMM|nr:MmgE/PrpD family protein [Edwardsiella hoshinae]QPR29580.1 MmgE/PrpD family protein [Edwardsiella hoshinae]STC90019.1 MmgE/PrpD family [Edwardsiella hoshinae]
MTFSHTLSRFIVAQGHLTLPTAVSDRARLHLLDTFGVALAGAGQNAARRARATLESLPDGEASVPVWGTSCRAPLSQAVLLNGIAAHALDFDDTHTGAILHGSALLTPVALALGQLCNSGSEQMLSAWAIGWEIAARVGLAANGGFHRRGFHATAVAGIFGACACAAVLLRLTPQQTCHALGLAGSQAAGVTEFLTRSDDAKCFHAGWAALSGIWAARLGQAGVSGPETIFEGRFGLYKTHGQEDQAKLECLTQGLGEAWQLMQVSIKPYPCCHFAHATLDCARQLRRHGITPEQIARIECVIDPVAAALICEPPDTKYRPTSSYAAKFSLPWLVAAVILDDELTLASLTPDRLARPALLQLARRIGYRYPHPGEIDFPRYFPGLISVWLHDGRCLQHALPINYGNPDNPLAASAIRAKFLANAKSCLPDEQAQTLADRLLHDAACPQPRTLAALLTLPDTAY